MSWIFCSGPFRRFAGGQNGFHSRRRRYRTAAGGEEGIIVLSPEGKMSGKKVGGGNSAKTEAAAAVRTDLNPEKAVGNEAENQPVDRDCRQKRFGDARRFAARDRGACWPGVTAPGKAGCATHPAAGAIRAAAGKLFPVQRAAAVFPPPL